MRRRKLTSASDSAAPNVKPSSLRTRIARHPTSLWLQRCVSPLPFLFPGNVSGLPMTRLGCHAMPCTYLCRQGKPGARAFTASQGALTHRGGGMGASASAAAPFAGAAGSSLVSRAAGRASWSGASAAALSSVRARLAACSPPVSSSSACTARHFTARQPVQPREAPLQETRPSDMTRKGLLPAHLDWRHGLITRSLARGIL